jgi:hypothetical protein
VGEAKLRKLCKPHRGDIVEMHLSRVIEANKQLEVMEYEVRGEGQRRREWARQDEGTQYIAQHPAP